jgi:hypothetical protein
VLQAELRQSARHLPLQQGLAQSSYALYEDLQIQLLGLHQRGDEVELSVGVFFQGIIPGCNCSDDPEAPESIPEYCELTIKAHRHAGGESEVFLREAAS